MVAFRQTKALGRTFSRLDGSPPDTTISMDSVPATDRPTIPSDMRATGLSTEYRRMLALHERLRPLKILAKNRRILAEGGWILVAQALSVTSGLVLVRILTAHLSPVQYGELALGLTAAGLVNQVVMGGISAGIARHYTIASDARDLHNYLRDSRLLLQLASIAVLGIGGVLSGALHVLGRGQWLNLTAACLVFSVFAGYVGALDGIQNAARHRSVVAFHMALVACLRIALSLAFLHWLGPSGASVAGGYACTMALATASHILVLRRTISQATPASITRASWARKIWEYSWPISTWGGFTWMQQVSDRWALETFASLDAVGQYAVLFQLGYTPTLMLVGVGTTLVGPILYQRAGDATDHVRTAKVHRIGWLLTIATLSIAAFGFTSAFFLHDLVFRIFVAEDYRSCSYLLPWIVLAGGVFSAGQVLGLKLMSELRTRTMTVAKIATALAGVSFNFIGARFMGLQGVVAALVLFSSIYLAWMLVLGRSPETRSSRSPDRS
ncbi:MAG: oligosaccharide flippase family protein [Myxococcales bacterium]|nr:oligosaccharide flippase family protein [Myxococcales bacterium]